MQSSLDPSYAITYHLATGCGDIKLLVTDILSKRSFVILNCALSGLRKLLKGHPMGDLDWSSIKVLILAQTMLQI